MLPNALENNLFVSKVQDSGIFDCVFHKRLSQFFSYNYFGITLFSSSLTTFMSSSVHVLGLEKTLIKDVNDKKTG